MNEGRALEHQPHVRRLRAIFTIMALTVMLIGAMGLVALVVTVESRHRIVLAHKDVAQATEQLRVSSERWERTFRTLLLTRQRADEAVLQVARQDFRRRATDLAGEMGSQLQGDLQRIQALDRRLSDAEDGIVALLHQGADQDALSSRLTATALPIHEDLDEAVADLARGASQLVAAAQRESERIDALAIGALATAAALAMAAIGALFVNLRAVLQRLREAQGRLQRITVFQQHLMGMVGHDIQSPLSAILVTTASLPRPDSDPQGFERSRARIIRSATRVGRMASMLMDVTRMQAGVGISITPQAGDLHELVGMLVDEARSKGGDRAFEHQQVGDGRGEFDDDRIAQVVTNLLDNATKYSPLGSTVSVVTRGSPSTLEVEVRNPGQIDPDLLPRVFEPFTQGAPGTNISKFSAGLGLYVVRQLTEAHGGRIEVRSSREAGTTFRVTLPRHWQNGEDRPAPLEPQPLH